MLPNNAFFIRAPFGPEGRGFVAFGATAQETPLTVLDVAAHEFMHGVTSFSADLQGALIFDGVGPTSIQLPGGPASCETVTLDGFSFLCDEGRFALASNHTGAINEGFSDVFGTVVEFHFHESGTGPLRADYVVGEDIPELGTLLRGQAGPIRSIESPQSLLINPPSTLLFPDNFVRRVRFAIVIVEDTLEVVPLVFLDDLGTFEFLTTIDGGALHWNSTILSHAFYLAIEGGQNATSGLSVAGVGAVNRDQIERVFFRAMTAIMPRFADFPITAAVLCQSARDLFGFNSAVSRAVDQALLAVGL